MTLLEVHHVSKKYAKKSVLHDCHFSINKGEIVGLMGQSGSGKSTLARLIAGLEQPSAGDILFQEKPYTIKPRQSKIQLVFQDAYQSVHAKWTILKILQEANLQRHDVATVKQVLHDVELDESYLNKFPHQLSGGQLQRVCIARALLAEPELIIFDEALSGLDPIIQGKMLRLLYKLREKYQQTYLFIVHDFKICYALCHRVLVLKDGKMVEEITDFTQPIVSQYINTRM